MGSLKNRKKNKYSRSNRTKKHNNTKKNRKRKSHTRKNRIMKGGYIIEKSRERKNDGSIRVRVTFKDKSVGYVGAYLGDRGNGWHFTLSKKPSTHIPGEAWDVLSTYGGGEWGKMKRGIVEFTDPKGQQYYKNDSLKKSGTGSSDDDTAMGTGEEGGDYAVAQDHTGGKRKWW